MRRKTLEKNADFEKQLWEKAKELQSIWKEMFLQYGHECANSSSYSYESINK